jgi:uncharacterized membrane protein YfcA
MEAISFREQITEAMRYWEPRRLIYNAALALIVLAYFAAGYPGSKQSLQLDHILVIFLLAVLANVAYCAAYVVDAFAQASGFRETWRKHRWIVFATGVAFAGIIARFFAIGFFDISRQ